MTDDVIPQAAIDAAAKAIRAAWNVGRGSTEERFAYAAHAALAAAPTFLRAAWEAETRDVFCDLSDEETRLRQQVADLTRQLGEARATVEAVRLRADLARETELRREAEKRATDLREYVGRLPYVDEWERVLTDLAVAQQKLDAVRSKCRQAVAGQKAYPIDAFFARVGPFAREVLAIIDGPVTTKDGGS